MELYRDNMVDMAGYDSGDAAELYSVVEKHKLDPEKVAADFEFYLDNLEELKKMRRAKSSTGDTENFKKRVEKKLKKGKKNGS